ncbi:MAG: EcoAI/FtnUII family type I restriction enzme subunit R, partial [Methermicoccaceae archaeon]
MLNEADTRAKLIDPWLHRCGWNEEYIKREQITLGRIIDENGERGNPLRADYVLYYNCIPLAVVEAKEEAKSAKDGIQQAKTHAKLFDALFAYSSNGHEIEEFSYITNAQRSVDNFPPPDEVYQHYIAHTFKEMATPEPLSYPYYHQPGGKTPRYYQEVAVKRIIEAILKGRKKILLTMATGTGKTYVAFQVVWKLLKSGYFRRVLYLADRVFLRDQAHNEFTPFGDARAIIDGQNTPTSRDVYFSIYQSMYSDELYKKYPSDFFDLIIIDECHRSGFGTWNEILQYFDSAVQLGMTATPKRDDNIDTYAYFGEPVYRYSMGDGIEDGFLAPYQIYRYTTNIDKQGLKVDEAKRQGAKIFIPEGASVKDLYTFGEFEREIVLPDRTAKICEHLAEVLRALGPKDRTIVFCVNMEHAALVAKELQNRFSWLGLSDYAVRIVSEEPYSDALFREFKDSEKETPVIATTVDLLTTGVDVPSVRNVVFLKPMSSKVYFKQHIGRGCRIDPLTNKYIFRIIDYVNATKLLDDWDIPKGKPLPEGPFDLAITGYVVDPDQRPISGVRVAAQMGPNLQRAAVTKEDGSFELEGLPHSSVELRLS